MDVVGQSRPLGLSSHFGEAAQMKYFEFDLCFDPEVGKLRDLAALTIDLLGFFGLHFLFKRNRRFWHQQSTNGSASPLGETAWTTLIVVRASRAVVQRGSVKTTFRTVWMV